MEKKCRTCRFHDNFTGACCNADSPHVADFTMNEEKACDAYEECLHSIDEDIFD